MISFTEKAADKILSIMNEQKVTDDTRVRVGVRGGGCSVLAEDAIKAAIKDYREKNETI